MFRCKGCGETETIVEVEVVPRKHAIVATGPDLDFEYGSEDDAFWEASITLGYACDNDECRYWQGDTSHAERWIDGAPLIKAGYKLEDIAVAVLDKESVPS